MAALEKVAPLYAEDGNMVRTEAARAAFEKIADDFVKELGGGAQPLHLQDFSDSGRAVEAVHKASGKNLEGVAAFRPIGELTAQDQGALRAVFVAEYGKSDPAAAGLHDDMQKLIAIEPEKETDGRGAGRRGPAAAGRSGAGPACRRPMHSKNTAQARVRVSRVLKQGFGAGRDVDEGQRIIPARVILRRGGGIVGALRHDAGKGDTFRLGFEGTACACVQKEDVVGRAGGGRHLAHRNTRAGMQVQFSAVLHDPAGFSQHGVDLYAGAGFGRCDHHVGERVSYANDWGKPCDEPALLSLWHADNHQTRSLLMCARYRRSRRSYV